ncbi:MAG: DUF2520 domain-containing protein [Prevotella sp.]|nr:DUF2520 domain-containing protein [Prevotella sp.]
MKIVIIGSGNLATQLSLAFKSAGKTIVQVFSRTEEHAKELADKIGCNYTTRIEEIRQDADVYIFSVKDDALSGLVASICHKRPNGLFLHTAGSMPMDIFRGHASRYGVLYPMQTFSKNRKVDFREIPCFVEGSDEEVLAEIHSMAASISDHVVDCDSEKRKKMHLAAVLACNLTNHCYRLAERLLESEQIDFQLFLPLIEETARKVKDMSPKDAQTGPMVRYDQNVMQMQMSMLSDERTREIYRLMAESIHEDHKSSSR